jgi:hypothetical protein
MIELGEQFVNLIALGIHTCRCARRAARRRLKELKNLFDGLQWLELVCENVQR